MKTKSKISASIIHSGVWAVFLSMAFIGLSWAFNSPHRIATASAPARMLTFVERVAYQRAIEEVYWRHRLWPKENPDSKPSLDAVMPQAQLEMKVTEYLRNSQALEDYWQRGITADQLQAEMDRMAQHTRQPEVLRELFAALGRDPFVIAECLARPVLAERLLTHSAREQVTQVSLTYEQVLASSGNYSLPSIAYDGDCTDHTWTATATVNAPSPRYQHTAVWTGSEMIVWGDINFSNTGGRYNPSTDSWAATSTVNAPHGWSFHTAVWTGTEMIVWARGSSFNGGGRYNPSTDTWIATSAVNMPSYREGYTAVWTGSEMIVWGGDGDSGDLNTGGRYNPRTDSWRRTSTTNAPGGRRRHTAVWTGKEMIIWGGSGGNTGGRYNPATNSWTATSTTNAPAVKYLHTAVWTGNEMIIWGGSDGYTLFNIGGRYDPATNTWTATSTTGAPAPRFAHTAVWTGSEMIVWGGLTISTAFGTGGRYNPYMNSWTATSHANAPPPRGDHTAVWTGNEMIVWGGLNQTTYLNTGGRYCAPPSISQLGNISTRAFVQTGNNVVIGGFMVQGAQTKRMIIRVIGPSLTQYGVPNALVDPTLELHNSTGALIASNDNWQHTIIGGIITSDQVADIGNSGHAPAEGRESAIVADLAAGNYTAIVRGVGNMTGVALVEVYDLSGDASSILGNISTRAFVQTDDNVMIGGFIVQGNELKRVIVRAIGPELTQYGVPNVLANPTLELHDGTGALIASNDNWWQTIIGGIITSNQVADIRNTGHAPSDGRESAIMAELPAGNYTAILRGVNNTTGVALVEVYDLDQ
jgi:N-acetylneuraminic acid mutarotase